MTDLLVRAREESRVRHERVERMLSLDGRLTLTEYRRVLCVLWGFFAPLEAALAQTHLPEELEPLKRRRAYLLAEDLASLGMTRVQLLRLSTCSELPTVGSMAPALGCMYVLEGSTLGGQIIARIVHQRLRLTPLSGCSFYTGYGNDTGRMWKVFCDVARRYVSDAGQQRGFLTAVTTTFDCLGRWLEKNDLGVVKEQ